MRRSVFPLFLHNNQTKVSGLWCSRTPTGPVLALHFGDHFPDNSVHVVPNDAIVRRVHHLLIVADLRHSICISVAQRADNSGSGAHRHHNHSRSVHYLQTGIHFRI